MTPPEAYRRRPWSAYRNAASDLAGEDPSKGPGGADVGIGASRRGSAIRPKEAAGSVVWAKLAKYPW